jgi:hypothetical protein
VKHNQCLQKRQHAPIFLFLDILYSLIFLFEGIMSGNDVGSMQLQRKGVFSANSKCKRCTFMINRTTYLSSAVFASCTSSVVQSPVATSGCDFDAAAIAAEVVVVACGAMVLGPAADAGNIIWP